ncbi:MAG TPA: hypothetical protein VN886_14255 [Acidimicrobiales bacterium]|nr:hypothetical protein [Acidimicrobiales bacterium]
MADFPQEGHHRGSEAETLNNRRIRSEFGTIPAAEVEENYNRQIENTGTGVITDNRACMKPGSIH